VDKVLIERRVKEESRDGIITCAQAFALAKEIGVKPIEIGKAADRLGVRFRSCQLGLF
jgi:hypothetical protein